MKHRKLTREQSKQQTRERLVDAARELFIERGFRSTSIEEIADSAGYTRGAFYGNFSGKRDLLIELLRRDHDVLRADIHAMRERGGTPEDKAHRVLELLVRRSRDDDSFRLWLEAKLIAARDNVVLSLLVALQHEQREQIGRCFLGVFDAPGIPQPASAEMVAVALQSLSEGFQLVRMFNRAAMSDEATTASFAAMLSSLTMLLQRGVLAPMYPDTEPSLSA